MNTTNYAKGLGIAGLVFAIAGFFVPIVGVLFLTPIAIILGSFALYGGEKGKGIAILVINAINLVISPTFWLNVGAGALEKGAYGNLILSYFDAIGIAVMIYLAIKKRK
jgi:hypothetical protein